MKYRIKTVTQNEDRVLVEVDYIADDSSVMFSESFDLPGETNTTEFLDKTLVRPIQRWLGAAQLARDLQGEIGKEKP